MTTEELQKNGKTLLILLACVVVLAGLAFWAEPEQKEVNQTTGQEISSANGDIVDLGDGFTKDKNNVYYNGKILSGADSATFEVINDRYAKDKDNIYHFFCGDNGCGYKALKNSDPGTFEFLENYFTYYSKDKNNVYFEGEIIVSADPATFKVLEWPYAKDKSSIYSRDKIIIDSDSATFESLGGEYYKDKNNIYSNGNIITNADKTTFEVLEKGYARDKSNVYYWGISLPSADPVTFEIVDAPYSRDEDNVYLQEEVIIGIDPKTFEIVAGSTYPNPQYIKDKNNVYYIFCGSGTGVCEREILKNSDPATFEILSPLYAKDKNNVYYEEKTIPNANPATFEVLEYNYAKDKNSVYYLGCDHGDCWVEVLKNTDPATFEVLKDYEYYAKDRNNVYFGSEILTGANPATFQAP